MSHVQDAFFEICQEAEERQVYYVALMRVVHTYGGPEEGGWYYTDRYVEAVHKCVTRLMADLLRDKIEELAKTFQEEENKGYGDYCLRVMDKADALGCDVGDFGEDGGPDEFFVTVTESHPKDYIQPRTGYC